MSGKATAVPLQAASFGRARPRMPAWRMCCCCGASCMCSRWGWGGWDQSVLGIKPHVLLASSGLARQAMCRCLHCAVLRMALAPRSLCKSQRAVSNPPCRPRLQLVDFRSSEEHKEDTAWSLMLSNGVIKTYDSYGAVVEVRRRVGVLGGVDCQVSCWAAAVKDFASRSSS